MFHTHRKNCKCMALKATCLFMDLRTSKCDWERKKQKDEALASRKITIRVSGENLWLHLQYYFSSRNSEVLKLTPWASPLTMLCSGPHSGFWYTWTTFLRESWARSSSPGANLMTSNLLQGHRNLRQRLMLRTALSHMLWDLGFEKTNWI